VGGSGVKVAVCTAGVLVGVTGVGVSVGNGVLVGTGVWVGVGVVVNVGFGVLVGVGVASSRRARKLPPEHANNAAMMAIAAIRITIRFLILFITPPSGLIWWLECTDKAPR
jgi:hypothetical protein